MDKVLTVSIAAYNVESYIRRTLESLIKADGDNRLEVIIVDDGSTDNTSGIAEEFCKKYPHVFKLIKKSNGGYGSTINASLKYATGKYFKLLDGDDWFQSEILCLYLDYLEGADSDIVLSPYKIIYMPDRKVDIKDSHKEMSLSTQSFEGGEIKSSVTHQELVVKTDMLKEHSVHITENCFYTDQEFVFQSLLFSKSITRFGIPVYCYQIGRQGQSVGIEGLRKHHKDTMMVANNLYRMYSTGFNPAEPEKNIILQIKLLRATGLVYKANIVRLDVKNAKDELYQFDLSMKNCYPEIYSMTNKIRIVKLLRLFKFKAFQIVRIIYFNLKVKTEG